MLGHDPRPELRDLVHEALGMAMLYASVAKKFLEVDDDRGAEYAITKFVITGKFAAARFKEIVEENKRRKITKHLAEVEKEAK